MDTQIMSDMIENNQSCYMSRDNSGEIVEVHLRPKAVEESLKDKLQESDIQKASNTVSRIAFSNQLKNNLCTRCGDVKCINNGKDLRSLPNGNINAKIMFINKQPTDYETALSTCCCDRNGLFFSLILDKINVDRESVYCTDMIKCSGQLDEPSFNECIDTYLKSEISLVNPSVIICNSLSVLKTCISRNLVRNLPATVAYGNIYDTELYTGKPVKITAIYDLDTVLRKTGDDYTRCKNELWSQVLNAFKAL